MVKIWLKVGLLLLAISILFNLTGCKNQNQGSESAVVNDLKPVTLLFYLPGPAKQQTQEVLDKASETSNLNVKLNFKWIEYNKYSEQITEALSAGESFDAFLFGRPEPGSLNFLEMFRNNQIKDITELLPRYAPSIFGQLSKYEIESAKVENKIVAIPSLFPEVNCVIAAVRQDLLDKYKISSITTLKEYGDFLRLIKENEENIVPGRLFYSLDLVAGSYGYNVLDYQQNLVYKKDDPNMKITPWEQTPEFKETAELISTWFKSGYIKPNNGQKLNWDH
jgi:putative aldouronate transport system substrate-binding protein